MNKKVITVIKTMIGFMVTLIGASIIGTLLLTVAYALPVNQVTKASTMEYREYMGWAPLVNNRYTAYKSYFDSFEPGVLDDATDSLILKYSLYEPENADMSVLEQAVYMQSYGRYWQGYVSILRIALHFVDYWNFLSINGLLQVSLVLVLSMLVFKETKKLRYPLAVLSSYLLLMPAALGMSLQFSPCFYIAFLGSIALILFKDFCIKNERLYYFFLLLGILTTYFDFLTYPLLTWAMPVCWYFVICCERRKLWDTCKQTILTAMSWSVGYVGMFLCKWATLWLVCGREAFEQCGASDAFSRVGFLTPEMMLDKETFSRFGNLFTNFRHYLFIGYVVILLLWMAWAIYMQYRYDWKVSSASGVYLLISLSAPAWYLVFANHTAVHHMFTYRVYVCSILAFLLFLCENVCGNSEYKASLPGIVKKGILHFAVLLLAFVITALAKQNVFRLYGDDFQPVAVGDGDVYSCSFTPLFQNIKGLAFILQAREAQAGEMKVSLYDGQTCVYEDVYTMEEFSERQYVNHVCDLHLQVGKAYGMELDFKDIAGDVSLLVTNPGNMPLIEYANGAFNGEELGNVELLGSFTYHTTLISKKSRLYLAVLLSTYLFAWLLLAKSVLASEKEK